MKGASQERWMHFDHPLYNKESDKLKWTFIRKTFIRKKDNYSNEVMEMIGKDFEYQTEEKKLYKKKIFRNFLCFLMTFNGFQNFNDFSKYFDALCKF